MNAGFRSVYKRSTRDHRLNQVRKETGREKY